MVETVNKKAVKMIPEIKDVSFETCLKGCSLSKTKDDEMIG